MKSQSKVAKQQADKAKERIIQETNKNQVPKVKSTYQKCRTVVT